MDVLQRSVGSKFQAYYDIAVKEAGVIPEWRQDTALPYGKIRWHRYEGQKTPVIILNTNLSQDVFESIAAHELSHMLQYAQGYPQVLSRRGSGLGKVAEMISDLVTDPDADNRLKSRGLWCSERIDKGFDEIQRALPSVKPEHDKPGKAFFTINALQYTYAKIQLSETQWLIARNIFLKVPPNTSNWSRMSITYTKPLYAVTNPL